MRENALVGENPTYNNFQESLFLNIPVQNMVFEDSNPPHEIEERVCDWWKVNPLLPFRDWLVRKKKGWIVDASCFSTLAYKTEGCIDVTSGSPLARGYWNHRVVFPRVYQALLRGPFFHCPFHSQRLHTQERALTRGRAELQQLRIRPTRPHSTVTFNLQYGCVLSLSSASDRTPCSVVTY